MQAATTPSLRAGIFGVTGTTGIELAERLQAHPGVELLFGSTREAKDIRLPDVDPAAPDLSLLLPEQALEEEIDLAFLCLPHGRSAETAEKLHARGCALIDLSGDHRLRAESLHQRVYGSQRNQALAEKAVYGLPESNRRKLRASRFVANPGCYATSVELALLPLARSGLLRNPVYVDAKSGLSGAGRAATPLTHFCSAHDDVRPYKPGRAHRHVPEMEQVLAQAALDHGEGGECPPLFFVPQLVPLERGILANCLVQDSGLDGEGAQRLYRRHFAQEKLVEVLPPGKESRIRCVARRDKAVISLTHDEATGWLLVSCAIDNLGKGAAGAAVQNMNVMQGWPETLGLRL